MMSSTGCQHLLPDVWNSVCSLKVGHGVTVVLMNASHLNV